VAEAIDSLPREFRIHIRNVAVLVEDVPPDQVPPDPRKHRRLRLGIFDGVPLTKRSFVWESEPSHIVLYQKNIEAVCANDDEVREKIRSTVIHEFGHYFGMTEEQLKDV